MNTLTIDLENCYGIKRLDTTLDFSATTAVAVYAPNGSMKTSLAKTFDDIANGVDSKDRIFPARPCKRVVKDENGADLPKDSVLVVRPYDKVMGHTNKTSTLLVNSALRKEHEDLHAEIDDAKGAFLKALQEQSHSKKDLEREISSTFTSSDDNFYTALKIGRGCGSTLLVNRLLCAAKRNTTRTYTPRSMTQRARTLRNVPLRVISAKALFSQEQSRSKKDLEREISSTFTSSDDNFYTALNRIKDEVDHVPAQPDVSTPLRLPDVPYDLMCSVRR